jgi:hypothetical protein
MSRKISFILTNAGTINAVCNSKAYVVPRDHVNYDGIKKAIIADDADALDTAAGVPAESTVSGYGGYGTRDEDEDDYDDDDSACEPSRPMGARLWRL